MNETDLRTQIREAVRQALNDAGVAASPDNGKPSPKEYFAPWTGASYEAHPSQQKFDIAEASNLLDKQVAQFGNLLELTSAQNCTIEKGKPCDQCGMCRSLGF